MSHRHTLKNVSDYPQRILLLWEDGYDTYDIATLIQVHESEIYNCLAKIREMVRAA